MIKPALSETQIEGFDFFVSALKKYGHAYIADVPGMGKTILGIRLALHFTAPGGRVLYITPVSVKAQIQAVWKSETGPKSPGLHLLTFSDLQNMELVKSYKGQKFDFCIVDEAHNIKTTVTGGQRFESLGWPEAERVATAQANGRKSPFVARTVGTLCVSRLAKYRLYMSGTPITKDPRDLFAFLWEAKHPLAVNGMRSERGAFFSFCDRYMYKKATDFGVSWYGLRDDMAQELADGLSDIVIRREHHEEKDDNLRVADPVRFVTKVAIPSDLKLADRFVMEKLSTATGVDLSKNGKALAEIIGTVPGFATLTKFREAQSHAKVKPAVAYVKKLKSKKFLFFCYHKSVVPEYVRAFKKAFPGVPVVGISSQVTTGKRSKIVREWNEKPEAIIIATMGSIGTGYDTNKFSLAVFSELDWSPAVMEQSEGRVQRKGSGLKPELHYLIFKTGVEAYINKNLTGKIRTIKKTFKH